MTFQGQSRVDETVKSHIHEPGITMLIPLLILAIGACFSGYLFESVYTSADFWKGALFISSAEPPHPPVLIHYLPLIAGLIGIALAYHFYLRKPELPAQLSESFQKLYTFLYNKWYVDELYTKSFILPSLKIGSALFHKGDQNTIDAYGPDGAARNAIRFSSRVSQFQSGYIYHYALAFIIGFGLLLFFVFVH